MAGWWACFGFFGVTSQQSTNNVQTALLCNLQKDMTSKKTWPVVISQLILNAFWKIRNTCQFCNVQICSFIHLKRYERYDWFLVVSNKFFGGTRYKSAPTLSLFQSSSSSDVASFEQNCYKKGYYYDNESIYFREHNSNQKQ